MTDTRELPATTGDPLTYSPEMANRLAAVVEQHIRDLEAQHERQIAELRLMVADMQARAGTPLDVLHLGKPPAGREPYQPEGELSETQEARLRGFLRRPLLGDDSEGRE